MSVLSSRHHEAEDELLNEDVELQLNLAAEDAVVNDNDEMLRLMDDDLLTMEVAVDDDGNSVTDEPSVASRSAASGDGQSA